MNVEIPVSDYRKLVETEARFNMLVQYLMDEAKLNIDRDGLSIFIANDNVLKLIAPEDHWDRLSELKEEKEDGKS